MKLKISKIKRIFTFLLIFLLSINSFAAVVADNDGTSFVTKGEFDTLKHNFAAQVNNYNTSLTNKIDGAIAEYIAGKTIYTKNIVNPIIQGADKIYCVDEDKIFDDWDWKGGQLHMKQSIEWIVCGDTRKGGWMTMYAESPVATNFTKLVIDEQEDSTGTKQPYWWGYTTDAQEDIESLISLGESPGGFTKAGYGGHLHLGGWRNVGPDGEFTSPDFRYYFLVFSSYHYAYSATQAATTEFPVDGVIPSRSAMNIANFKWGTQKRKHIITWHDADSHFSIKDSTKYWRNSNTDPVDSILKKTEQMATTTAGTGYIEGGTYTPNVTKNPKQYPDGGLSGDQTYRICFGFHPTYKKFSQLVMKDYSDITVNVGDGKYVNFGKTNPYSGWPLCASKTGYRVEFTVDFEDKTKDYIVAANDVAFSLVSSGTVAGNLQISADNGKTFNNTVTIKNGHGKITYDNRSGNNHVIWLKWSFASGNGGGVLSQPNDIQDVKID